MYNCESLALKQIILWLWKNVVNAAYDSSIPKGVFLFRSIRIVRYILVTFGLLLSHLKTW